MANLSALLLLGVSALLCGGVVVPRQDGVRLDEELASQPIPVEAMSQCAEPLFCDDSTPGTGHGLGLFPALTDSVVAVERCYSYCFSQLGASEANFSVDPFPEVYGLNSSCQAYVCFLTCSLNLPTSAGLLRNITQLPESATCSELCTIDNGICDRALPTDQGCDCATQCNNLCASFETAIPVSPGQDVPNTANNAFALMYAESFMLARQGVLEFSIPNQQPDGTAYGVIWRVHYDDEQNMVEEYIPQHLPFLFLQTEVGPLYRVGSNMLSIRQLQCLPGVNLSYALVNAVGVSEFSEPQEQCFYGNAFPQPPSGIHVRFGFVEEMAELELEVWVDQPSTDAADVTDYGLQVFTLDSPGALTVNHDTLFPDANDLHLLVSGTSEVERFLPTYYRNTTYLFGVFSLPQANMTRSGRVVYPASNWVKVHADFPEHPLLNGTTECYSISRDHLTGLANITLQFKVHTGWRSLVTVATIQGEFSISKTVTLRFPFGNIVRNQSVLSFTRSPIPVEPAQSTYTFSYTNARPSYGEEFFHFQRLRFTGRFQNVLYPRIAGSDIYFLVKPLPASPVINLEVCYNFTRDNQSSFLTVEAKWEAPMWPEGEINEYNVFVNSSLGEELETKTVLVQTSNYLFELSSNEKWQGEAITVWVRAMSTVTVEEEGIPHVTAGEWSMVSLPPEGQSQFAVCARPCQNGGTCTAPNTCTCAPGWSGSQCTTVVNCGDPGTPSNGRRTGSSTTYNSVVTYTCNTGYTRQGSSSRTCQSNGQWSGSLPRCNPVNCGDPDTPSNGQRTGSSTTYNSVVTYTCNTGYRLEGSSSRTCQSNGQWSKSLPRCIRISTSIQPPSNLQTSNIRKRRISYRFTVSPTSGVTHKVAFIPLRTGIPQPQNKTFHKSPTRSRKMSGLTPDVTYRLQVVAVLRDVESTAISVSVTTKPDVPTGPPQGLAVANRTTTSITVTWRDPAPDRINDRDGVTGFVVRRNRQRVATVTDQTYTFTGLQPATNYTFEVLAVNDQGRAPKKHAARLMASTTVIIPN